MPIKKRSAKVTVAQSDYIQTHHKKKSVKELAADTGLTEKAVQKLVDELSPPPPKGMDLKKFGVRSGSVVMTPAQAEQDDEYNPMLGKVPKPRNDEFFEKRTKNAIHKIDPSQPCH